MSKLHNELRELWEQAGYHSKMGSAAVVPPPSKAFKRLYHLTTAEHAISDIVFGRVKVALLHQLNDPFEFLSPKFLGNRKIREATRSHKDKLAREHGLICFSSDWTDPVLWTHYAAKHQGICLGFDVVAGTAEEVSYQVDRIEVGDSAIDQKLERRLLLTKYESWRYEQEWRLRVQLESAAKEGDIYFEKIGTRIHLAEVILGAHSIVSTDEARALVDKFYAGVVTFKARLANGSFQIVPHESTIPSQAQYRHVR